ncbi:hypothetical protein GCM10008927_08300 [Amylibacter ulvae]|uniref:Rod shape-determining protein MreD n=1 Tax=Paramylibacter ulvae TaxID=1651968 RepID=A0ABQ3CVB2_9RHOB|nr:hypothetical protein [Amylibacter ulvae]GHA45644.1 hypothetical protein GCM10008927_08300 [Amylibacter ulvae]
MDEVNPYKSLRNRAIYFGVCMALIFLRLIPLDLEPNKVGMPDFILCITAAIVIRKAIIAPYVLVGLVFLIADIMLSRPLGLGALIGVVGIEIVRNNRFSFREMFFLSELFLMAILFALMAFAQQLALSLVLADRLPLHSVLIQLVTTIACYPIVVFVISQMLRISKPAPGEFNAFGHKL